jgi:hypothetical protein
VFVDLNDAQEPEAVLLKNRFLQVCIVMWATLYLLIQDSQLQLIIRQ